MDKFDTEQGKLFYTIYLMHKENEISADQKGKLKDLIICRHPSLNKIETGNVLKARRSLLDIADQTEAVQFRSPRSSIKPIVTNSKYKSSNKTLMTPPSSHRKLNY